MVNFLLQLRDALELDAQLSREFPHLCVQVGEFSPDSRVGSRRGTTARSRARQVSVGEIREHCGPMLMVHAYAKQISTVKTPALTPRRNWLRHEWYSKLRLSCVTDILHTTIWESGVYRCVLVTTDEPSAYEVYLYSGDQPIAYERCSDPSRASEVAERLWRTLIAPGH